MFSLVPLVLVALTTQPIATTLEPPAAIAPAPQAARVHVSPNSTKSLGFDWDGKSVGGAVHQVPAFRVILVYTNPLLAASNITVIYESPKELDTTQTKIPLSLALRGIPSGDWNVTAALEDVAGNRGPPSVVTPKSELTVSADPPTAPQNVGVID